jgi:GDP-L-fucose synthase
MEKILLTGGNGFIGRNIREQLSDRYEILSPSHAQLDLLDAGAVAAYLAEKKPDAIVHAASLGVSRKKGGGMRGNDIVDANTSMFLNLAKCAKSYERMVSIGSGAEYDHARPLAGVREEEFGRFAPSDAYGLSKYACAKYIEQAEGITNLRVFGCFGKYEDYGARFISNAICRSLCSMPILIANRNVRFSYLYVNDLVRIIDHFIGNGGKHKSYNAVPDESCDLLFLAEKIKKITGNTAETIVKNEGMGPEYTGSNERLRAEVPGFEFTPIEKALSELCGYYSENIQSIDRARL